MDTREFDRFVPAARRLLGAGLVAALLAVGGLAAAAAQPVDSDADGLFDVDETSIYGTNPLLADTDLDGVGDGEEIFYGTNPLVAEAAAPRADSDGDGLFDADESGVYGTNSAVFDTDNDGVGDGQEVFAGTDPLAGGGGGVANPLPPIDPVPPIEPAPAPQPEPAPAPAPEPVPCQGLYCLPPINP